MQTATISGQILSPDLTANLAVSAWIEAATVGSRLTYNGNVIVGRYRVDVAQDGTATVAIPINGQAGLTPASFYWKLVWKLGSDTSTKQFQVSGDTTWGALVDVSNTPLTNSLVTQAQNAANQAAASAASVNREAANGVAGLDASGKLYLTRIPDLSGSYVAIREAPLSPYRYGFVGDGSADDTTALNTTISNCPAGGGGEIDLPHYGNAKITSPLIIDRPITIRGRSQYAQRLLAVGCDGIHMNQGLSGVHLEGFEIAQSVRWSTTANTFVGITVDGIATSVSQYHIFRDLYLDGFKTGLQTRYMYQTDLDNVRVDYGQAGLMAYGKSVNNTIDNCQFRSRGTTTGSPVVALYGEESSTDSTTVASEGWVIANSLLYGGGIGLDLVAYNHVYVKNNWIDSAALYAVRLQSLTTAFCNNVEISGNYIAVNSASASAAILLANAVSSSQLRYARITNNDIWNYAGQTCPYGIVISGSQAKAIVRGNTLQNFGTYDIDAQVADNIIQGNTCLSSVTPNIHTGAANMVNNNIGSVYRTGVATTSNYSRDELGRRIVRGPAAPTSGAWVVGERVMNDTPAVGSPKSWVCTVAGSPGTWVSEGNL